MVPGRGVVIASFCPSTALSSVLLPTLGRPTIATLPARAEVAGERRHHEEEAAHGVPSPATAGADTPTRASRCCSKVPVASISTEWVTWLKLCTFTRGDSTESLTVEPEMTQPGETAELTA